LNLFQGIGVVFFVEERERRIVHWKGTLGTEPREETVFPEVGRQPKGAPGRSKFHGMGGKRGFVSRVGKCTTGLGRRTKKRWTNQGKKPLCHLVGVWCLVRRWFFRGEGNRKQQGGVLLLGKKVERESRTSRRGGDLNQGGGEVFSQKRGGEKTSRKGKQGFKGTRFGSRRGVFPEHEGRNFTVLHRRGFFGHRKSVG